MSNYFSFTYKTRVLDLNNNIFSAKASDVEIAFAAKGYLLMQDNFNLYNVQKALNYTFKDPSLIKRAFVCQSKKSI